MNCRFLFTPKVRLSKTIVPSIAPNQHTNKTEPRKTRHLKPLTSPPPFSSSPNTGSFRLFLTLWPHTPQLQPCNSGSPESYLSLFTLFGQDCSQSCFVSSFSCSEIVSPTSYPPRGCASCGFSHKTVAASAFTLGRCWISSSDWFPQIPASYFGSRSVQLITMLLHPSFTPALLPRRHYLFWAPLS